MTTVLLPTFVGKSAGLFWSWLNASQRQLTEAWANDARDRSNAEAIRELSRFEDHELNDIGLCRSDLTPEGLAIAGNKRSLRQAAMDAEIARR